jgi:hypothetical protein
MVCQLDKNESLNSSATVVLILHNVVMNMWIATIYLKFSTEIASDEGTEAQLTGLGFPVNRNLPIILTRIDE